MVSQKCWNEDYHWRVGTIKEIEVDDLYEVDERVYLASKDEKELELELDLSEHAINLLAVKSISHQDEKQYKAIFSKLKNEVVWQKAIILYIE